MSHPSVNLASEFRRLHSGPDLLILPNAWDAGSARLVESLGARAVATTSAGVAWSHGYADGHALPVPLLVATVSGIAKAVRLPVSADVEGGYSSDPVAVGDTVARVLEAGAVGINLEDGAETPDLLCAKIERARRAAASRGVDLFINARTDVYLRSLAQGDAAVEETLARAGRYRDAGCDGLFVPGLVEPAAIRTIAGAIELPLNVLARPGLPPPRELQTLGVRRLSAGGGVSRAAWSRARAVAAAFLAEGCLEPAAETPMGSQEINGLLRRQ